MNQHPDQAIFYTQRIAALQLELKRLYRKRSMFGWLRFATIAAIILIVYAIWSLPVTYIIAFVMAGIGAFLLIVSKDAANKETIQNKETLVDINKKELQYTAGDYSSFYDGKNLEPEHHAYAADLDLFGRSSLFQYINRGNAEKARAMLAQRLLEPSGKDAILLQQEAIKELSGKPLWQQQLQSFGTQQQVGLHTERHVLAWIDKPDSIFSASVWKYLLMVYPVISLLAVYLFIADMLNSAIFSAVVFAFYLFSLYTSKRITVYYTMLSGIVHEIAVLQKEMDWFEKETFNSELLTALQQSIQQGGKKAAQQIAELERILNRFDVRLNVFAFIFLNTFLLWDLRQMMALKKWKQQNKNLVPAWFDTVATIEMMASFGTLAFNHPDWCFPVIADKHFTLSGRAIGHPLISLHQRVNNDFSIAGTARVDLITGSNMAGKSTFLRSLGINMVLALAGAPVCAKQFTVSPARLMSSMRITDNLAENTSTFYAELKKLQSIIEVVNRQENVFILLDEILRGTNSLDRHTGSAALIKQFIHKHAVAIIATHDVELAKLECEFPGNIANYHFDVQVNGEELYFDYTLKEGICTSLNASLLMKKIGIVLQ